MFKILLSKKATKYYEKLDDKTARKVNKAIEEIGNNPFRGTHIKRLIGNLEGKYRYKLGHIRIVYIVNNEKEIIIIEAIGARGDIYK
ncbi:MAG: RelE/StbE replicon stabilization toxin [Candidatus Jettenia ecosi]|uniref:RelE/StbE replicon stabilization toxin n=1 Tax=Candidatus Jettenia ecosi TaxID=2494326 RepID=A0A533QDN0_9BACT|nr:MAG: RelE/StbE replicon stabilization toxin [Candidatus Jettenia ecosi]